MSRLSTLLPALLAGCVLAGSARAGTAESPPAPPADPPRSVSFLDPVGDFLENDVLRPKTPFELVPGKDPNGWGFAFEPYLWFMGISGDVGVANFPAASIHMDPKKVLQHLDWGLMAQAEVRHGRWGILADGLYAKLSGDGELGKVLYQSASLDLRQALASLALAYRVVDDRRGFLDVYAGARYNYLGVELDANLSDDGIDRFAQSVVDDAAADLRVKIEDAVRDRLRAIDLPNPNLRVPDVIVQQLRNALEERLRAKTAAAAARAQQAVNAAKKKLSASLADQLRENLPTSVSGDRWWIDPLVGLRGQINFTRWLFLAAQSDIGGFGVGSQLTWNVQATIGVNFTRNVFAELGYRYMYIDYDNDGFLYNVNTFGIFSSLGVKF